MRKTVVINAVGLTRELIGPHTPRLQAFMKAGAVASVGHVLPAVTTSVQATYLTGAWPAEHGIVGNGWYFRDECEIKFWKQSNHLVQQPKIWEIARQRDARFTCANICWWYAMYSSADFTVTPRPMYPADGRKLPDCWTHPANLREQLQAELGQFPLFRFWGPATDISATQWIADAAMWIDRQHNPTLTLVYLPHLDYCLQRRGPEAEASAEDLRQLDRVCGQLIDHFSAAGARIVILSEYGIEPVSQPVHLNRVLREHGLLAVREELGRELLDAGESAAFAVADHQVAHVYVNDPSRREQVRQLLAGTPGVERVLDEAGKAEHHLNHPRAGDFVVLANEGCWFTYYYWLDEERAPDFARTVDIHRKPGYDPAELFIDPKLSLAKVRIAAALARKMLGFRYLMQVIPLDATLVKGSHGGAPTVAERGPLLMSNEPKLVGVGALQATAVRDCLLNHVMD